jgi:hypothetical protein
MPRANASVRRATSTDWAFHWARPGLKWGAASTRRGERGESSVLPWSANVVLDMTGPGALSDFHPTFEFGHAPIATTVRAQAPARR